MTVALQPVSRRKGRAFRPRLSAPYVPGRRAARFWTEPENDVLRRCFTAHGVGKCQAEIAALGKSRPVGAIYQQAYKLGLRRPRYVPGGRAKKYDLTPALETRIREAWPELAGRGAVNALAVRLQVPRWWLTRQATKLGLTAPHKKEPPWTAAEIELMRRVPIYNPDRCAEIFKAHGFQRTPTSIVVKAKRLALSRRYRATFSATACARVLGIDNKTFALWCGEGLVRAERRADSKRLPQQGGAPWSVTRAELRRFIVENLERIDFRKVDKFALVDVLTNTTNPGTPLPDTVGHNAHGFGAQLEAIVGRIEELEVEKKEIGERIKSVYQAAGARGFDAKTLRGIVRDRKKTAGERAEEDRLRQLYRAALGMLDGTPLGDAARKRLAEQPPPDDERRDDDAGAAAAADAPPGPAEQEALDEARQAGSAAAMRRDPVTANPYPAGDPCRAAWDEAWCRAAGSDGMDIPDSWRRKKPKKEGAATGESTAEDGGGATAEDAGDGA